MRKKKTLTRADLCEAVYRKLGLSRLESARLVDSVLQEISDTLVEGENVKLSAFGSFSLRKKRQRMGRNPKTGEEAIIHPRTVLTFHASNKFKDNINAHLCRNTAATVSSAGAMSD